MKGDNEIIQFLSRVEYCTLKPLKTRLLVGQYVNLLTAVPGFHFTLLQIKHVFCLKIVRNLKQTLTLYLDKRNVTMAIVSKLISFAYIRGIGFWSRGVGLNFFWGGWHQVLGGCFQ